MNIFIYLLFALVLPIVMIVCRCSLQSAIAGFAVYYILPHILNFLVHRAYFRRLLARDGLRLTELNGGGFVDWGTLPAWWEWRDAYHGRVADQSGRISECTLTITGPLFALVACRMQYHVHGNPTEGFDPDDFPNP